MYGFTVDGMEEFPITQMSDWAAVTINSVSRYYVRVSDPSNVDGNGGGQPASINQIIKRPVNSYCTTKDVFDLMQLRNVYLSISTDFDGDTQPTKATVEDYIQSAESMVEHRTRKQWRLHYVDEEYHQFNMQGMKSTYRDIFKLLDVSIWDGQSWEAKTLGRGNDIFYAPETGMLHWARFFVLPARFTAYTGPVFRWGGGEFSVPVKLRYIAGRSFEQDPREAGMVYDATRKLAAVDIVRSADFGGVTVSGMDRVMLAQRADAWAMEAEDMMDSLRSFEVF